MIQLIDIPTEQTTAATDAILAVVACILAFSIFSFGKKHNPVKSRIWTWTFGLLAFAAFMGTLAHGFLMTPATNYLLWQPLNLALGLTVSMFVVGVIYDLNNTTFKRSVVFIMIGLAVIFYIITVVIPGLFIVFIMYEALAMLFALVAYIFIANRKKLAGAWLMVAGIFITIVAAGIQATETASLHLIWEFDYNGVFHLVQLPGLILLYLGVRKGLTNS